MSTELYWLTLTVFLTALLSLPFKPHSHKRVNGRIRKPEQR